MGWNDTPLALYRDIPRDMALARSEDGGRTWTRSGTVGAFGWTIEGCPDVGGSIVRGASQGELHAMVWTGHEQKAGLYVLGSRDNGKTWGEPVRVGHARAKHSDLAFDGRTLAVAWDAAVPNDVHVGWSYSTDGGRTWVDAGRLSAPGMRATHPRLAATRDGIVAVWTEAEKAGAPMAWKSAVLTAPAAP